MLDFSSKKKNNVGFGYSGMYTGMENTKWQVN